MFAPAQGRGTRHPKCSHWATSTPRHLLLFPLVHLSLIHRLSAPFFLPPEASTPFAASLDLDASPSCRPQTKKCHPREAPRRLHGGQGQRPARCGSGGTARAAPLPSLSLPLPLAPSGRGRERSPARGQGDGAPARRRRSAGTGVPRNSDVPRTPLGKYCVSSRRRLVKLIRSCRMDGWTMGTKVPCVHFAKLRVPYSDNCEHPALPEHWIVAGQHKSAEARAGIKEMA